MIDATIEQKITSKLSQYQTESDAAMPDSHEPRFAALEKQVQQLQQVQQGLAQQSSSFAQKLDYLNTQVEAQGTKFAQTMEIQLANQMSRIEALMEKRSRHE